jgi:hypothetical protein
MEKTYVIIWKSKLGPFSGQGRRLFTREEAEQLSAELNQEHPKFVHDALNLHPGEPTVAEFAGMTDDRSIIRDVAFGSLPSETAQEAAVV